MAVKRLNVIVLLMSVFATSVGAELRHVEMKTLGMD